jgi:DNA polymerase III subunit beta
MMSKVTVAAGDLAKAMKLAAQVVEKRNTIPILSNVLIEVEGDCLTLTATDMDLQFRQDIPAAGTGAFAVTVPAHRLAAVASTLRADASLTMTPSDGNRITLTASRSRWVLATLPRADFPLMPGPKVEGEIVASPADFAGVVARVLPFRCTEPTRYYINGPLLHGEDGKVALVAVDGYRLMRVPLAVDWPEDAPEVILAPKACRVLAMLGGEKADLRLAWDGARISAVVGRIAIIAKVIDGTFPDYRRVIGIAVDNPLRVDPEVLRGALSRLLIAGDQRDSGVLIDPTADGITLSMKSDDTLADASEEVLCEVGDQPATKFNARYLQEILSAVGGDTIEIHMADGCAPSRINRVVPDGSIATVMPQGR